MRKLPLLLSIVLLFAACHRADETPVAGPVTPPLLQMAPAAAIVEFDDALTTLIEDAVRAGSVVTKSAPLDAVLQDLGIESLERVFPDAGEYEPRTRREGLHRFYRVKYAADIPVTKAVDGLASVPGVLSVTPVKKVRTRAFNDPLLDRQWHFVNTRNPGGDINVQSVWDNYTTGSQDVIVCVVDEGIWPAHPDLSANMWNDGSGHCGYNFVDRSYNIVTDMGHGTHVAGVIGAVSNNGIGVAGIAGGNAAAGISGIRLMSCAIFMDDHVADDYQTAAAIKWGADHGAVISNNSWGYYADGAVDGEEDGYVSEEELEAYKTWELPPVIKKAIDYFIFYAGCDNEGNQLPDSPMKGGLVLFAAGNEGIDYDVISSYAPVISVGAFNYYGERAGYSNYGDYVDIAAPGGQGTTSEGGIWSTVPLDVSTSGYEGLYWTGTSMACPHASGVASLLVSYFGGQGFTQEDCRKILLEGIEKPIGGNRPIGKKLDAAAVFEYGFEVMAGKDPDVQVPPQITLSAESLTLHAHEKALVSVSVRDVHAGKITVSCTPGSAALVFDPATLKATISGKNAPAGTYEAVFVATNESTGLLSRATLRYTLLPNHAPQVITAPADCLLRSLEDRPELDLSTLFLDMDGETLRYVVSSSGDAVKLSQAGTSLTLLPQKNGLSTVTISAVDGLEDAVSVSFLVAVRLSLAPMEVYPVPATTVVYFWPDSLIPEKVKITFYAATGAKVLTVETLGSAISPVPVDITYLSPAKYTAIWEYGGKTSRQTVVKI